MEPYTNYLMWMRSKNIFNSINNSCEEQVFAEDGDGVLGGFLWPPRSYSCSFCKREFKSAQALGGHMNVHRRDRARLKQSLISLPSTEVLHDQPQNQSMGSQKFPNISNKLRPSYVSSRVSSSGVGFDKECQKGAFSQENSNMNMNTKLSIGIGLVNFKNFPMKSNLDEAIKCKRHKSCSSDKVKVNSMEDIDLELRLGDPSAVK